VIKSCTEITFKSDLDAIFSLQRKLETFKMPDLTRPSDDAKDANDRRMIKAQ
jgi:hypothetical protein